jgi:hypothetical protein
VAERQLKIIDKVMADMKDSGKGVREDFLRFNKAKVIFLILWDGLVGSAAYALKVQIHLCTYSCFKKCM